MPSTGQKTKKSTGDRSRESFPAAELFINSVPSILIGIDDRGCINRWNRAAAETFGLEEAEVLHKPLSHCGIRWLNSEIDAKIADLLRSQGRLVWDGVQFEKAGAPRLLGMTVTWIKVPHSRRGELLIVGSDITLRKRTEDELRAKTAFFEAQIQATIDGMLVVDENGNILLHNERVAEIFEIPPKLFQTRDDNLVLKHVVGQVVDPSRFLERVKYLYSHRQEKGRDEIKLRNGRVLDRYSSPVFGPDGHYYGRIWSFHDITERKHSENALRQLSVAVEQSPVSVIITDLEGNITYVNRRFTECTGYSYEEVIGRNPRLLKSEDTTSEEHRQLWQTILRGEEWRGELRNKKKNGDLYWESVVISPIRNRAGETSHFLAVKEDITDRKIAESHSRQAQKLEAIGQLAAGIAHEINTPIQFVGDNLRFIKDSWAGLESLISLCESLQGNTLTADALQQLRRILRDSDSAYLRSEIPRALDQSLDGTSRVAKIVRAMKEFSHPGSDEAQPADINQAILTTLTVSRNEWKYVAELETSLQPNLQMVPCHLGELNQVFLNLLINSAHALAEVVGDGSQKKGKITIRTTQDLQFTTISVQDTGAGIRQEIQSRIFDPFFTTKGVGRGTGQGLSLAYNSIVKKHGGKIWFESEAGKGTTFFIQLPTAGEAASHVETNPVRR